MERGIRVGFALTASETASNAMGFGAVLHGESNPRTAELAARTAGDLRRIAEFETFLLSKD